MIVNGKKSFFYIDFSKYGLITNCWNCLPMPFNTMSQCTSQTEEGMAVKEGEWRESTFHEGWLVQRFGGQMPFLSPTSAKDIHWNSSFLQPPTDFWRKGRHFLLSLLSDMPAQSKTIGLSSEGSRTTYLLVEGLMSLLKIDTGMKLQPNLHPISIYDVPVPIILVPIPTPNDPHIVNCTTVLTNALKIDSVRTLQCKYLKPQYRNTKASQNDLLLAVWSVYPNILVLLTFVPITSGYSRGCCSH